MQRIRLLMKGERGKFYRPNARLNLPVYLDGDIAILVQQDGWEGEMGTLVIEKVVEQLKVLPSELQWRVFEFTRSLTISVPRGIPGRQLFAFAGSIPAGDLDLMRQAIEEGCELS